MVIRLHMMDVANVSGGSSRLIRFRILQRVHPEGGCNPAAARYLSREDIEDRKELTDSPFSALKGLFDKE